MNVIALSGNVGKSELKDVNGTALLTFSLAVKKYDKNNKDATEWFNCNLWGSRATGLEQYIVKGAGISLTGEMQINYNPEKKQSYPQVHVNNVDIIKWAEKPEQQTQQRQEYSGLEGFTFDDNMDDVSF